MTVDLNQEDLFRLVRGTRPPYEQFDKLRGLGIYSERLGDWFWWTPILQQKTETELWEIYKKITK